MQFVQCMQIPLLEFRLDHSGYQPFNYGSENEVYIATYLVYRCSSQGTV